MSADDKTDLDLDALSADVDHLSSDGADASGDLAAFHRLLAAAPALIAAARERDHLRSALERTEANFIAAVNGRPVRDMAETLAENRAALTTGSDA